MTLMTKTRYIRIAPRKIRLVSRAISGMDVRQAENQLEFLPKRAAQVVLKSLRSAVASAKHNFDLDKENLYIKKITADIGSPLKRWRPRAFGRAAPIKRQTTHLTIILDEKKKLSKMKIKKMVEKPEKLTKMKMIKKEGWQKKKKEIQRKTVPQKKFLSRKFFQRKSAT